MRALSPLYHAVSEMVTANSARVVCRDLRIRNLKTRFGELTVDINAGGVVRVIGFRV